MKAWKSGLLAMSAAALTMGAAVPAAFAEDEAPKLGYSLTITATSDYIFRGISLTDNEPAFQPYLEFTYGIGYFGIWASNIDAGIYEPVEVDLYLGIRPTTGPISWDLGVLYYAYPDAGNNTNGLSSSDLDYFEFQILATWAPVDKLSLTGKLYYTPEQDFLSPVGYDETFTLEGVAAYTLPEVGMFTPVISAGYGYSESDSIGFFQTDDDNYSYWNAGLALSVEKFTMDFRYWDTNIDETSFNGGFAQEKFVFSAKVALP
jgi:uncharacterized protein (TIGR02001 family)